MANSIKIILAVFFLSIAGSLPLPAHAIPPPDIIYNYTGLFVQIFSFAIIIFVSLAITIKKSFKKLFSLGKISLSVGFIITLLLAYAFYEYKKPDAIFIPEGPMQYFLNQTPEEYINAKRQENRSDGSIKELSLDDFKDRLDEKENDFLIFDARNEEDYANGHISGAKLWQDDRTAEAAKAFAETIDKEQKIVFYCDFGFASYDMAKLFYPYHEETYYVNDQTIRWLDDYYIINTNNEIKFPVKILNTEELLNSIKDNAILIDPRSSEEYTAKHLPNTYNIPISYINYSDLIEIIDKLPSHNGLTVLCNKRRSCDEAYLLSYIMNDWSKKSLGFSWGVYSMAN